MAELYLTTDIEGGGRLTIGPITGSKLARCPEPPEDTSGYFLIEDDPLGPMTILARVTDENAAFRLGHLLGMS